MALLDKKKIGAAVKAALDASKGKRKFTQSVDLAINFQDVDFKSPEARISVDVVLPHQAREVKVAVFADGQAGLEAKKVADMVYSTEDITNFAADKKKQKELMNYSFLATPQLMAVVGKNLGQFLGARGRLPKPLPPNANAANMVEQIRRQITLKSKGKYLPVLHAPVGRENMKEEDIAENVVAVLEAILKKTTESNIASVYVKTTMGAPVKIAA